MNKGNTTGKKIIYPEYQPEIEDISCEYNVIMCYLQHNRFPKGVLKSRKSHLRKKAKTMELKKGILFHRGKNDYTAKEWVVNPETQEKNIRMVHIGKCRQILCNIRCLDFVNCDRMTEIDTTHGVTTKSNLFAVTHGTFCENFLNNSHYIL